jgi:hypothetical protein
MAYNFIRKNFYNSLFQRLGFFTLLLSFLFNSNHAFGYNAYVSNNGASDYYLTVAYDFSSSYVEDNTSCTGSCNCYCGIYDLYLLGGSTDQSSNYFTSGNLGVGHKVGSLPWNVGPNAYYNNVYFSAEYTVSDWAGVACAAACGGHYNLTRPGILNVAYTASIKSPINVNASIVDVSSVPNLQFAQLTWSKGSDIPDNSISYNIYRNGTFLANVPSSTFSYNDSSLLSSATYTYAVTTITTSWGTQESQQYNASVNINITNNLMTASDGTYYGKSQLSWINIASFAPNDIAVSRNGQQLAVVNKNSTTYNDFDGVPGIVYDYSVSPILSNNTSPWSFHDNGSARPNGIIKGNVYTIYNAAVPGVTMYAYANVDGNFQIMDSTISDASGYYQFGDLFYDTSAVFTLVPHKGSHKFNPDTLTRTLGLNNNVASGVNFTDTSVFTIKGAITFSPDPHCAPGGCLSTGVTIYNNGVPTSGVTDANGQYSFAIQQEGTYTLTPVEAGHTFSPASVTLNVVSDSFGLNFTDLTKDTLFVKLEGGCQNQVAHHALVSIASTNGSYRYNIDTIRNVLAGTVSQTLVIPAQPYSVTFIGAYSSATAPDPNINSAFTSSISVDLTTRDSSTLTHIDTAITVVPARLDTLLTGQVITIPSHSDTTVDTLNNKIEVKHLADFVYHGLVTVSVLNFPLSTSCPSVNGGYIMDQGNQTPLRISITEFYAYDSTACPVDSGQLDIYDDVSDAGGVQTVNFYNGKYDYTVVPGSPNIASPYLKLLQFFALVGNSTANWGQEVLVTGHKPHTQTFVTKTPELPFFILHAPPGNNSYSYLSQDSSVTYSYSNSYQYGGSAGPYVDAKIGAGIPIPFTGITVGAGVEITADAQAGQNVTNQTDVNSTFTAHTQISTSNINGNNATNSLYSGHQGDVYVGGSFNMIYALTDVIELKNCQVVRDTQLAWGANGLATNYIYTEDHIVNTLIPQLQELKALSHGDTIQLIQSYIDVWNQVVAVNHKNADTTSTFVQNISFSAGAVYDNTATNTSDSTVSINYNTFLDVNVGIGVIFGENLDEFANTQLGVKANFQWNMNKNSGTNVNLTKTFGYHLEDDAIGDFFSVDVKKDHAFGTPAFGVVAGASSCPHWPGTQARDSVQLSLGNYAVANVPINQTANFTAHIVNLSESQETRTYNIEAVPESNPDGAIISIGGQQINNSPASFTVAAGTDLPVILTVAAGPIASDYNGLQVSASSPCDGGEGNTITFEAHFQSTCSPIGIYTPSDNWLVNASSNDSLLVIFSGYNANDSNLINIGLQYRSPGGTWLPATNPAIPRSALTSAYYNFLFNVTALPDGPYELRAYANCGAVPGGETFSPILSGVIDRSALSLFGTPSPADGVLNLTQDISVTFNGSVNCNQAAIYTPIFSSLVRNDNGQVIPDSVTCNGNQLIIYTNPPSLIDSLENVTLTATINNVYDVNGNSLQQPIVWSFLVSRSKVYWNPANVNISAVSGSTATATGIMNNVGPLDTFTIIHMPSWLSTPQAASYIITNGTPTTPSQLSIPFTVSNSLNPGTYTDTVIALVSGKKVFLFVNLDVVKPGPNWTVNANNYQYSMNITTNYSTTQLNTPLSSDTRDIIAAFVGNQCRGVGYITYNPLTNNYSAFVTAYSNSVVGDTFTFRMWDALPGIEYQAVEHLPFVSDGSIGQPAAAYILHAGGQFQTTTFVPGWNWFSLDVASGDMSPANVLGSLTGNNGAVVKTQNSYDQFTTAATGWRGTLNTFSTNTSYMINLDHADTLHFLGLPITDTSIVQIASGWNWVGFPRQKIATATSYLANVNASNGDILKSQTQFAQYNAPNWAGSLNYMYPGEGYKLKTANAFNFVIPPLRSLPSWNVDDNLFEQNMTVTADLQFNGTSTTQSNFLVGAFANNVCIGTAQPEFIPSLNLYRVFITIHGDTGNVNQPLTFKVYDTDNDIEYAPSYMPISVSPDTIVAKVEAAYVINVQTTTGINALTYTDGFSLLQNVPNPFSKTTSIEYNIPSAQQVTMTLYDESGRMVKELVNGLQSAGSHSVSFEQDNLQAGVYFYQMKSGEFVKTRRMLILQQ